MKYLYVLILSVSIYFNPNITFPQGSWSYQFSGTTNMLEDVYFISATTGWAVGWHGTVLRTTNGGTNWINNSIPGDEYLGKVRFINAETGWMTTSGGSTKFWKTTNSGINWFSTDVNGVRPHDVQFVDSNNGFICGDIYPAFMFGKTTNGGLNWTTQTLPVEYVYGRMSFVNSSYGWIIASDMMSSRLLKTTDGGDSWTVSDIDYPSMIPCFKSILAGWAAGERGSLIKSNDGGSSWIEQSPVFFYSPTFWGIHFSSLNTGWCVGSYGTIMRTVNGGSIWNEWGRLSLNDLLSVFFISENEGWVAGAGGTILHYNSQFTQPLYLDLTVLPEGMCSSTSGQTVKDTVRVYVRRNTAPFEIVESAIGYFTSRGSCIFQLNNCQYNVPYYLEVEHRNTLETWSASPVIFSANSLNYNFTGGESMAYGGNLAPLAFWYCLYSGDVNKDGIIDISDMAKIDNDSRSHATGYRSTDINGDLFVDGSDFLIADWNAMNFVAVMKP